MAKKVKVNKDACIGCGLCASTCSDLFEIGDDGLAQATTEDVPAGLEADADACVEGCPVQAIEAE